MRPTPARRLHRAGVKLHLTLAERATAAEVEAALACARAHGAARVEPLFPDPALPELARYFVIEVEADPAPLLAALHAQAGVESVERGPRRKLR